jgi:hypothetical protein
MKSLNWTPLTPEADALGESPFWHPQESALYWVDIPGRALRRAHVASGLQERWPLPSEPGCIAPMKGGGLLLALREGLFRARHWGAALSGLLLRPMTPPPPVSMTAGPISKDGCGSAPFTSRATNPRPRSFALTRRVGPA